jgi:hypothetical protein
LAQVPADLTQPVGKSPDHRRDMSTVPTLPRLARGPSLAPARRAGNVERRGFVTRLHCECALPSCRETFPAGTESYRGTAERFIVVPAHLGAIVTPANLHDATVVRAADRFFVVELDRSAARFPAPSERRLRLPADSEVVLESKAG